MAFAADLLDGGRSPGPKLDHCLRRAKQAR
jgi:hypothetical protein